MRKKHLAYVLFLLPTMAMADDMCDIQGYIPSPSGDGGAHVSEPLGRWVNRGSGLLDVDPIGASSAGDGWEGGNCTIIIPGPSRASSGGSEDRDEFMHRAFEPEDPLASAYGMRFQLELTVDDIPAPSALTFLELEADSAQGPWLVSLALERDARGRFRLSAAHGGETGEEIQTMPLAQQGGELLIFWRPFSRSRPGATGGFLEVRVDGDGLSSAMPLHLPLPRGFRVLDRRLGYLHGNLADNKVPAGAVRFSGLIPNF